MGQPEQGSPLQIPCHVLLLDQIDGQSTRGLQTAPTTKEEEEATGKSPTTPGPQFCNSGPHESRSNAVLSQLSSRQDLGARDHRGLARTERKRPTPPRRRGDGRVCVRSGLPAVRLCPSALPPGPDSGAARRQSRALECLQKMGASSPIETREVDPGIASPESH